MNKQRIIISATCYFGMIAILLHWYRLANYNYVQGFNTPIGWIAFVLLTISFFFCFVGNKKDRIREDFLYGLMLTAVLSGMLCLWEIYDVLRSENHYITFSFGLWMLPIISLLAVIYALATNTNLLEAAPMSNSRSENRNTQKD